MARKEERERGRGDGVVEGEKDRGDNLLLMSSQILHPEPPE